MIEVYDEFVHLVRFLTAGERSDDSSLSLAQHSLLGFIARNPGCRATDISEVFGVNRSTVSSKYATASTRVGSPRTPDRPGWDTRSG